MSRRTRTRLVKSLHEYVLPVPLPNSTADKLSLHQIAKNLAKVAGTEGIPYLKFIINPDSFSQTVENMFYFSFLVREQKVALEVDDDADSPWYEDMIACEQLFASVTRSCWALTRERASRRRLSRICCSNTLK